MSISVIIPTIKGRKHLLNKLLASLPDDCEKIIVDDEDLSLAAKRNKGAAQATGDYLLFIDDDNYMLPGAFAEISKVAENKSVGVAGMVAVYNNDICFIADGGSIRHLLSGFTIGKYTNKFIGDCPHIPYEVDEVANAFIIRKNLFIELGGFDEVNFPIDLDEADFCRRAKQKGYKILYVPMAKVAHSSITYSRIPDFRRSKNAYYMGRNKIIFQRKHLSRLKYMIYLIVFMPIFVIAYCLCLLYRVKLIMIYHFLKGVFDGLRNSLEGAKRYSM